MFACIGAIWVGFKLFLVVVTGSSLNADKCAVIMVKIWPAGRRDKLKHICPAHMFNLKGRKPSGFSAS